MAALDHLDQGNLVTVEVADQLTEGCMENFRVSIADLGSFLAWAIRALFMSVKAAIDHWFRILDLIGATG